MSSKLFGKKCTVPPVIPNKPPDFGDFRVIHSVTEILNRVEAEDLYGFCPVCTLCYGTAPFEPEHDSHPLQGERCVVCGRWHCRNCGHYLPDHKGNPVPVCKECLDDFGKFVDRMTMQNLKEKKHATTDI